MPSAPGLGLDLAVEPHAYDFGSFRLDASERRLTRDGTEIALTARAFDVLLLLVRSRGSTVTKEAFMDQVWRDAVVEESNLTDNISTLRQLLGDDARDPIYIKTVPKRGYRFLAQVQEVSQEVPLLQPAILVRERSRTHVIVEEELADTQPAPARATSRLIAAGIGVAIAGATLTAVLMRFDSRPKAAAATPVVQFAPVITPVTSDPAQEFSPALSPDGKLVAFCWSVNAPKAINVYVRQTDVGEPIRLTTALGRDSSPAWSPDGRYIAFTRRAEKREESGLYVIPALGGVERRLIAAAEIAGLAWSRDGKRIAFAERSTAADPYAISLLDLDTLERRSITRPHEDLFGDYTLAFSPDGARVAFVRLGNGAAKSDLYVTDVAGGEPRRITFDEARIEGVAWDARQDILIYASNRDHRQILWKVPSRGGTPVPLEPAVEAAYEPSLSADGQRLVYTRVASDTNIYRLDIGSPSATAVPLIASSRQDRFPRVSPDGSRIAFESDRSGHDEIWLAAPDGSRTIQLTSAGRAGATRPAWSPDSKQVAYVSHSSVISEIYVIAANGGKARRLTSRFHCAAPAWSRDGQFIYFSMHRDGAWQVWRAPAAGGEPVQVTRDGGYESAESTDGTSLIYNKYGYNTVGLYRQPLAGGDEELLHPLLQLDSMGDWAVTAKGIYFIHRHDAVSKVATHPALRFLDFATRKVETVAAFPDPGDHPGLSILDGGRTVLFSRGAGINHDVMLISNYR